MWVCHCDRDQVSEGGCGYARYCPCVRKDVQEGLCPVGMSDEVWSPMKGPALGVGMCF